MTGTPSNLSWFRVVRESDTTATIFISGQVGLPGAPTAGDLLEQIGTAKQIGITITNCPGGACDFSEVITSLRGRSVVTEVRGYAYSAGAIFALLGQTRRIERGARLMLHPSRLFVFGTAPELAKASEDLAALTEDVRTLIAAATSPQFAKAISCGADHYFDAEEALTLGLATEIFDPPALAAPAAAADQPPCTAPAVPTEDETLFLDFLNAFGTLRVTNRETFVRDVAAWAHHHSSQV